MHLGKVLIRETLSRKSWYMKSKWATMNDKYLCVLLLYLSFFLLLEKALKLLYNERQRRFGSIVEYKVRV